MEKIIYENKSELGTIEVWEHDEVRGLFLNGSCQGTYNFKKKIVLSGYLWRIATLLGPDDKNILMIGGGALLLTHAVNNGKFVVVDRDSRMFDVARRYFDYEDKPGHRLVVDDGRAALSRLHPEYPFDCVILDAFDGYSMDKDVYNSFKLAKDHIGRSGAVITNVIDDYRFKKYAEIHSSGMQCFGTAKSYFGELSARGLRNIITSYGT